MCLAQGHYAVTLVRLEPAALRSRVKYSTTEPLRSQFLLNMIKIYGVNFSYFCIKRLKQFPIPGGQVMFPKWEEKNPDYIFKKNNDVPTLLHLSMQY